MGFFYDALRRPGSIGIMCAIGAVVLGLAYLGIAGAPIRYLGINAGALVIGLLVLAVVGRMMREPRRWPGATTLTMAGVLLATALLGSRVDGVARWVKLGALLVEPSLILLPVMIVAYARSRNALSTAGMIGAAAALAIEPDRAMAGMLAAGLTVLAVIQFDRLVATALAGSIIGFAITLVQADTLPAMPYVEKVFYSSFGVHASAGAAVLVGSILLIVPAIAGWRYDEANRKVYSVFGVIWLEAILAAALGNYPTPVVGYGGSAIIGYVLSLTMLPRFARGWLDSDATSPIASARPGSKSKRSSGLLLRSVFVPPRERPRRVVLP